MSQWNIKPSGLLILACVIFLMLLIVVLPDVDLPDAAFHNDTAPAVVHAHATSAPGAIHRAAACPNPVSDPALRFQNQPRSCPAHTPPNLRPILLRSIRC